MNLPPFPGRIAAVVLFALLGAPIRGTALRVVPTYENASVYVEDEEADPSSLRIFIKAKGDQNWVEGPSLAASSNDLTPRGSVFGLKADTGYELRCEDITGRLIAESRFTTWSENPPIAETIHIRTPVPDGEPLVINKSGSPEGWIRYVADDGVVIDGGNDAEAAILVRDARYVILEGLVVHGGRRHGIHLQSSQDIRVRNCDISDFGRVGIQNLSGDGKFYLPGESKAINWDAGIFIDLSGNLTIENCYIHDPRSRANSWYYSHPAGPTGIFVRSTGGVVVRYNDIVGGNDHRWNDAIESYGNGKFDGGFNCDSDIYGNFLAYANDDGIELDGGQCNVRFYGNKIEGGLCGISTAANRYGPSYVIGNLVANLGDERGVAKTGVKNGGGTTYSQGVTFFYHNTFLTYGTGIAGIGYGKDDNRRMFLAHARNNLFATSGSGVDDSWPALVKSYDFDLFDRRPSFNGARGEYEISGGKENHGLVADVKFTDASKGLYTLAVDSNGRDAGERLPGMESFQSAGGPVAPGIHARMPLRPGPVSLDHGQILLGDTGDAIPSRTVLLTCSSSENTPPQAFRILKNSGASWLRVEPSEGLLHPGESIPLKVTFDSSGQNGQGLLYGAAIVKFDNANSLPLTVYAISSAAPLRKLFEVEKLTGSEAFTAREDASASGNAALRFVDEVAGKSGRGDKVLHLSLDIPASGAYYLAFRTRTPRPYGMHDSLYVSMNGGKLITSSLTGSDDWTWSPLTGERPFLILPKGTNHFLLIPREEIELDAVLVSERPLMAGEALSTFLQNIPTNATNQQP